MYQGVTWPRRPPGLLRPTARDMESRSSGQPVSVGVFLPVSCLGTDWSPMCPSFNFYFCTYRERPVCKLPAAPISQSVLAMAACLPHFYLCIPYAHFARVPWAWPRAPVSGPPPSHHPLTTQLLIRSQCCHVLPLNLCSLHSKSSQVDSSQTFIFKGPRGPAPARDLRLAMAAP